VSYRIKYTDEVKRALPKLPGNYRQRVRREIEALADNPRPDHAEPMHEPNRYKIKLDNWRLIYRVIDEKETVRILRINKRDPETYEGLEDFK
jgi:mRNA-degrading endonuclease RelE of RelBE toxin-antitoxin system